MKLSHEKIIKAVPIREPMLCIEEISELKYGHSVIGYREIKKDEGWAKGHFVDEPIFPGTLIIETMAQIGGFIFYDENQKEDLKSYLVKVDKVKFLERVIPDCRLFIHGQLTQKSGKLVQIRCKAYVEEKLIASGDVTLYFINDVLTDR